MPPLSLATRELRAHLPSVLIYSSFWCILGILILSHFHYFSTRNFPLPFGIFFLWYYVHLLEASVFVFCFCFYFERESKIENEKMKELKKLQKEEDYKKESLKWAKQLCSEFELHKELSKWLTHHHCFLSKSHLGMLFQCSLLPPLMNLFWYEFLVGQHRVSFIFQSPQPSLIPSTLSRT